MKNLLKISCVLAIALFVSMSVKATDPLTSGGNITVNVPAKLELVMNAVTNVAFEQAYDAVAPTQTTAVQIKSNVNWMFTVATTATNFTPSHPLLAEIDIPVSSVTLSGAVAGTLGTAATHIHGSKNMASANITWTLADLGNIYADLYTAPVTFALVAE